MLSPVSTAWSVSEAYSDLAAVAIFMRRVMTAEVDVSGP
jgi:hypothetical protein